MNMTIRPMTQVERMYVYSQSQQIMCQTGSIGHLRADFGSDGKGFYSSWTDHQKHLNTAEFKAEIDQVINALRFNAAYDGILASRRKLESYCWEHMECSFGHDSWEYGIRVDTEEYTYLLRLNPNPGVYNLYAYCYVRKWLGSHMKHAEKGIRFITPNYDELFRIPDGDQIRITTADGDVLDRTCRYIDETHLEIGSSVDPQIFHICQFAELTQRAGSKVIPLRSSLPDKSFATIDDEIVVITKGAAGWTPAEEHPEGATAQEGAEILNLRYGVTKGQAAAMLAGATRGWAISAANPASYDALGNPLRAACA